MSSRDTTPLPQPDPGHEVTSWTAIRRGDVDYVIRRFWEPVHKFLAARLPRGVPAEDATQDFFLSFVERNVILRLDENRGRCRALVFHMARAFLVDQLRRHGRRSKHVADGDEVLEHVAADDPSAADEFDRTWFLALLDQARRAVKAACSSRGKPEAYRAFRLFYFGDASNTEWSQAAIAEHLGIPVTQVNNYLHRGRKVFAAALRELVADTCDPMAIDDELGDLKSYLASHRLIGAPHSTIFIDLPAAPEGGS